MSYSPTYVSRLDPQFRRFVNVVYHTSPTASSNDDKDEAATSLASSSCSEKLAEFLAVDEYAADDSCPRAQGQRQVSEFYLEYANVLSSGSETSFVNDDKEIATSTTTSNWAGNPRHPSNLEQRYNLDRIPSDFSRHDSVFLSDGCDESFYDENGINYCLQKRPIVSIKRSDLHQPVLGSFSSEADSEGSYSYRNEAERSWEHLEGIETSTSASYAKKKDVVSSVPWLHGQEVISRGPQNTSRKMDDSFEDLFSVDSELCYSPDAIEDGYSSTSSADSSFVCFALVGKEEDERKKRKIVSRVGRKDEDKKHRSRPSSKRRESEGKENDQGVMACVVSGISGGPAIRVFRNEDSEKSYNRSKRRELLYPRDSKEALSRGEEKKRDETENTASKEKQLQIQNERSNSSGRGFVFGVFGAPGNCAVKDEQSDGRLSAFDGSFLRKKPFTEDHLPQTTKRIERGGENDDYMSHLGSTDGSPERTGSESSNENQYTVEDMVQKSNTSSDNRSSREDKLSDISKSEKVTPSSVSLNQVPTEIFHEENPCFRPDEVKPLSHFARQNQIKNAVKDGKDLHSSECGNDSMRSMATDSENNERSIPLKSTSRTSGLAEQTREVRVKAISKSPKVRRPRRKLRELEQQDLRHEKESIRDSKPSSREMDSSYSQREHEMRDDNGKDLSEAHNDVNMQGPSLPFDPSSDRQEPQETGTLESRKEYLRQEALLKTHRENISDDYSAVAIKTELLTPVKQTINESIRASFLDNSNSDSEWQVRPNESDRSCPEGRMDDWCVTDMETFKHSGEEKITLMQISDSSQANLEDVFMAEDVPGNDLKIAKGEVIAKRNNEVFAFESPSENALTTKKNWNIGGGCDKGHDNDGFHVTERDMNDNSSEQECSISASADDFASKGSQEEDGFPVAFCHGVTREESIDTVCTWKPDGVSSRGDEMEDTNEEPKITLDFGLEPMEETSGVLNTENDKEITRQLRKRKEFSPLLDSQNETKRKTTEEEKCETGFSKKIKCLSEKLTERDELRSQLSGDTSEPSSTTVSHLERMSSDRPEEDWTTAIGYPGHSCEETPRDREKDFKRDFLPKRERGRTNSSEENVSRERAMESDRSSTVYSTKTTSILATLKSDLSQGLKTDGTYVLINHDEKSTSTVPEVEVDADVASTQRRLAEEIPEISSSIHQSSLTASSFMESISTHDIEDVETASSKPKLKLEGSVQHNKLVPDNVNRNYDGDGSKLTDFSLKENNSDHFTFPDEGVAVWCDIERKDVSTGKSIVLVNKSEVSDADEETTKKLRPHYMLEETVIHTDETQNFTKPASTTTILSETSRPGKVVNMPDRYSYEDRPRTHIPSQATLQPLLLTGDSSPFISAEDEEFGSYDQQDADSTGPKTVHKDTESSNNELCVSENVCSVAFDDKGRQLEDGARNSADTVSLDYCDEAADVSTKTIFGSSELSVERNAFCTEREMDSSLGTSNKMNETDNGQVWDEEMRGNEIDEIACSSEGYVCFPKDQWIEGYGTNDINPTYSENGYSCPGDVDIKLERDVAYVGTKVVSEDVYGQGGESVETRGGYNEDRMDGLSGNSCYGSYQTESRNEYASSNDTEANREKEKVSSQRPAASSASLQQHNSNASLEEKFETVQPNGRHTDYSDKHILDQQFQVDLLQDCQYFPEYKTKESQTSYLHGTTNKECQTNEVIGVRYLTEALEQQSVECQTKLPTNSCVSCGVPIESFDFQDGLSEEYRYTAKECQTMPDDRHILTSSKQCQTSPVSDEPLHCVLDERDTKMIATKAAHDSFFASKECQTSEKCLLSFISGEHAPHEVKSYHQVCLLDKESQTSRDIVLIASSAQCDILPFHDVDHIGTRETETSRLVSFDSKECQTTLDADLLLATSKHCQTSSSSLEIPVDLASAGDGSRTIYISKECQTLPASFLTPTELKECQAMEENAWDTADASKGSKVHQNVYCTSTECQTMSKPTNHQYHSSCDLFETLEVDGNVEIPKTLDRLERNTPSYENKESQTTPEREILLTSSKLCQTTNVDTAIVCENKECQTLLDDEIFLISSKECQTMPYGSDDLDPKSPIDEIMGSRDIELSHDANNERQSEISSSSQQMASRNRPATYGKSPESTEESFFEFQSFGGMDDTNLFQSKGDSTPRPLGSSLAIDVSDKGCQAMLCDCGNCADEQAFATSSSKVSSDPKKGYFLFFFSFVGLQAA